LPANVQDEVALWELAKKEFPSVVQTAKKQFGDNLKITVIGKNLGGSVAEYSVDDSVSCLIVAGSVPNLSTFWVSSAHPIAVEYRKGFSQTQLDEFQKTTSRFDLAQTIPKLDHKKILVQFGTKDPWIEKDSANSFVSKLREKKVVQWTDDDHAMASTRAAESRRQFIEGCE
jgi:hypothetical protein